MNINNGNPFSEETYGLFNGLKINYFSPFIHLSLLHFSVWQNFAMMPRVKWKMVWTIIAVTSASEVNGLSGLGDFGGDVSQYMNLLKGIRNSYGKYSYEIFMNVYCIDMVTLAAHPVQVHLPSASAQLELPDWARRQG